METVSVRVPAFPEYVRIVRLVAAGLAARLRFTIEEIEDLKIGVDELSAYLTGAQGRDGELEVRFEIGEDRVGITGVARFSPGHKVRTDLTELSQRILETVADSASLEQLDGFPSFRMTKRKKQ